MSDRSVEGLSIRHEITTPLPTYQSTIEPSPPTQHTVITMRHQDTLDTDSCHGEAGLVPPSYDDVVNTTDGGDKYSIQVEQETELESTPPIATSIDHQVQIHSLFPPQHFFIKQYVFGFRIHFPCKDCSLCDPGRHLGQ